jgi:hypothetical protein
VLEALGSALEWALATRGLQRWLGVRLESLVLLVTAVTSFAAMGLLDKASFEVCSGFAQYCQGGVCTLDACSCHRACGCTFKQKS